MNYRSHRKTIHLIGEIESFCMRFYVQCENICRSKLENIQNEKYKYNQSNDKHFCLIYYIEKNQDFKLLRFSVERKFYDFYSMLENILI